MRKQFTFFLIILISAFGFVFQELKADSIGFSENGILKEEWRYDLSWYSWGWFGSSPAILDLGSDVNKKGSEPDSDLEIITGSDEYCRYYPELGKEACGIWRVFDSKGNVEWAKDTETDESRSSPVVVDLDGDGDLEIVGGTTSGYYLQVLDNLGNFVWTFPKLPGYYMGGPFVWTSSPAVADINKGIDGLEIVIGNRVDGKVYALDGANNNGKNDGITINSLDWFSEAIGIEGKDWDVLWTFNPPEGIGENGIVSTPAIADIDKDDKLEVVVGSTNGNVYILNASDGQLEHTFTTNSPVYSSPALANIDGDKYLEIIVGSTDNNIYCFQWNGKTGKTKWTYSTQGAVYSSPAIEDIDEDGEFEIIIGSNDGRVYSLGASGNKEWDYTTGGAVYSSPAIANRGENFGFDIYIGSDDGHLHLLDGKTGTKIDRFEVYGGVHTSPSVADIDGDNKLEIVFYDWGQGSQYQGHTFWVIKDTQSQVDKYSIQWGMFRGNPSRTGSFRIRPFNAIRLATDKEVIGAPYLGDGETWGGKGEDCSKWPISRFASSAEIKEGYYYYDRRIDKCSSEKGKGLDCSGLIFWSYNRAYFGEINFDRKVHYWDYKTYPLFYDGANSQYKGNSVEITKQDLRPGDLLFYNPSGDKNKKMTHVMMYVGPFLYEGKQYNVIHAEGVSVKKITPATYNPETEEVITPGAETLKVTAYGRVNDYKLDVLFVAHSPVDLIITDPEGEIITKDMRESLSMAYMIFDINGDGEVDDIVAIPERKIGNYSIQVIPEPDALPTDTYSLEVTANGQTVVLAQNVPIKDIPSTPYIIKSTETEIIPIIPIIPMKSFSLKKMLIFWGLDCPEAFEKLGEIDDFSKFEKEYQIFERKLPKKCFKKENSFTIFGTLELPDNYQRENLDKSAFLYLQIADKLGKDKVIFKELKNLWLYQEPWKWQKIDDSLNQGIDIKTMLINWLPEKECKFKWFCQEKLKKNWFYIRGQLSLEGINIDTLPRKATITLEIPITPYEKAGSLSGKETIEFKKLKQIWFYHSPIKWKDWPDGWWKKWDNFQDQGGFKNFYFLRKLREAAAAIGLYSF